jgi:hypothetical protein
MKKSPVIVAVAGLAVLFASLISIAAPGRLSADIVREVFLSVKSADGEGDVFAVNADTVAVAEGSFTRPGATEAVVAFVDANQPHVALPGEIWLLGNGSKWAPILMIDQSDEASFLTVDIAHDGTAEVLYTLKRWLTGGILLVRHSLVTLKGGNDRALYTVDGTSYAFYEVWKEFGEQDPIRDHELRLEDVNGDGTVELIDTELSGEFVHTGAGDDGGWEIRYTPVATAAYRFVIDTDKNILGVERLSNTP